jgi:cellulose synthase/poly-beta-1,6-N-acetylglucosamine synthase-like glycosyltransferase
MHCLLIHHDQSALECLSLCACVIGTAIRLSLFRQLGGFWEWPAWEDWALFLAAHRRGAVLTHVPEAVYYATVRADGRNSTVDNPRRLHAQIRAAA